MRKNSKQLIKPLTGTDQIKKAFALGLIIVQVSFDNENDPVFLVSKERLSNSDYIAFVNSIGIYADKYRIIGCEKEFYSSDNCDVKS